MTQKKSNSKDELGSHATPQFGLCFSLTPYQNVEAMRKMMGPPVHFDKFDKMLLTYTSWS
jgi:hypothetical protein